MRVCGSKEQEKGLKGDEEPRKSTWTKRHGIRKTIKKNLNKTRRKSERARERAERISISCEQEKTRR